MTEFWYDTNANMLLVGEAAIESRLGEIDPAYTDLVVPLSKLVVAKAVELQTLVCRQPALDSSNWTRLDWIHHGQWALGLINEEGEEELIRDHFVNLRHLGLGSLLATPFYRHFSNLTEFKVEVGSIITRAPKQYADMSIPDLINHGCQLARKLGRPPTRADYDQVARTGGGPTAQIITEQLSIGELNEYMGYPDITSWDTEDYISWGVRFRRTNPNMRLTTRIIRVLSKQGLGPSERPIYSRFSSLPVYFNLVEEHYRVEENNRQELLNAKRKRYTRMAEQGLLPPEALESDEALLSYGGKRLVIDRLAPNLTPDSKLTAASSPPKYFVSHLKSKVIGLTAGHIESDAVMLDVFDDIWPITIDSLLVINGSNPGQLQSVKRPRAVLSAQMSA